MVNQNNLKKSILITGASSGIGRYAVEILAMRGWVVFSGYRDEKDRRDLISINKEKVIPILIDVTDIDSIENARRTIEKSNVPLVALFNNAGVALGGPIENLEEAEVREVFDVNFFGCFRLVKAFLPLLRSNQGRIINMSSMAGLVGVPFLMPYSASKFAIEGFSDSLRRELASQNVQVAIIEPGPFKTKIWEKSINKSQEYIKNKSAILSFYQPAMTNFTALLGKNKKFSIPLNGLKKVIISAVESVHPKTRYLVYRNNLVLRLLINILPDRFLDFLFQKTLG